MSSIDSNSFSKQPILPIKQRWNLLAIFVGLALASQVVSILQANRMQQMIERIQDGDRNAAYEMIQAQRVDGLGIIISIVGILAVVFVCTWFYRAGQNIHMAEMKQLNYTPGWYVAWFFIPVVQLVMPFITTIELWKASASINNPDERDGAWKNNKLSLLVVGWYVFFIAGLVTVGFFFAGNFKLLVEMGEGDMDAGMEYFKNAQGMVYWQIPFHTLSGLCLIFFSKKITEHQLQYSQEN